MVVKTSMLKVGLESRLDPAFNWLETGVDTNCRLKQRRLVESRS